MGKSILSFPLLVSSIFLSFAQVAAIRNETHQRMIEVTDVGEMKHFEAEETAHCPTCPICIIQCKFKDVIQNQMLTKSFEVGQYRYNCDGVCRQLDADYMIKQCDSLHSGDANLSLERWDSKCISSQSSLS
eukprot:gnl/MRDRNA2_/MRDRNA2_23742_c0_seq1.p1 gnl/MRDRNA2_/MRDRNA2_23742_c0~~gnl/MRDRNA2_/MRDRNA2_23742_c0_seq1.p1  ORF type:complete len:131 (-),score=3.66 gnl/MRDRNA2_/MRDRNA2_23742_c0_seq1:6-398(-)